MGLCKKVAVNLLDILICNAPGNPAYQINIPISDVFYDPPIPAIGYVPLVSCPAIPSGNFIIDLYEIQQMVLKSQPR